MKTLIGIASFIVIWEVASVIIGFNLILPSPMTTFHSLMNVLSESSTYYAIFATIWKTTLVLIFVIVIGIPIGFVMGINDKIYETLRPTVMVIQAVPVISWLALVIFLWGLGWRGPVLISFLSLLPTTIFTTASGVNSLDKTLIEMAKVYDVAKGKKIKDIYLGALAPFVFATIEVSIGNVWKVMIMAEYLCGTNGIGVLISWARQYVDVPKIYALTSIAVILGVLSERAVKKIIERTKKKWAMSY